MKHPGKGIVFLLSILLSLCANGRVESRDKSSSTPTILISFDGAQAQVIEKLLKSGKLPANGGFAKLISEGTQAQGMTAVLPTVTATNHITLATGAYPERTNIPANTFHLTDTPLTATTSGFGTEIELRHFGKPPSVKARRLSPSLSPAPMDAVMHGAVTKLWDSASSTASL